MKVNLGSGKNYLKDYVNIDINPLWKPDYVLDISQQIPTGSENKCEEIIAHDVLEHIPNLVEAMTNCLRMLKTGGTMDISVPYYLSLGAWQDPTHVRAFNENSWLYYTDWFWYLGWTDSRFEVVKMNFILSEYGKLRQNAICLSGEAKESLDKMLEQGVVVYDLIKEPQAVDSMHVILRKIPLTDTDKKTSEAYHGIHQ